MGTDSIKRALRGLKGFARRLPISFHILQPASEKHIVCDSDTSGPGDDAPPAIVSFAIPPVPIVNKCAELGISATPVSVSPSTTELRPSIARENVPTPPEAPGSPSTGPPALSKDLDHICPICGGFDSRLHSDDSIRYRGQYQGVAAMKEDGPSGKPELPCSLLWEAEAHYADDGKHLGPRPAPIPSGHCAPSWSPVSVTCPVRYGDILQHLGNPENKTGYIVTCKVLDVSCELASLDPSYPVQSGRSTITVKGLMSEVKCRVDPASNCKELVRNARDSGTDWSVRLAQDVLPPKNMAKEWDKVEERLIFLPVIHYGSFADKVSHLLTIEGLALRRVAGMMDYFTRVGTMRLQFWVSGERGLSWQDLLACAASGVAEQIVTII